MEKDFTQTISITVVFTCSQTNTGHLSLKAKARQFMGQLFNYPKNIKWPNHGSHKYYDMDLFFCPFGFVCNLSRKRGPPANENGRVRKVFFLEGVEIKNDRVKSGLGGFSQGKK